jgi:hypothetical protein
MEQRLTMFSVQLRLVCYVQTDWQTPDRHAVKREGARKGESKGEREREPPAAPYSSLPPATPCSPLQVAGGRWQGAGSRGQEAGGRRQGAGGRSFLMWESVVFDVGWR